MKRIVWLVSTIFLTFSSMPLWCGYLNTTALFMGSIQFPEQLVTTPTIRIYYQGTIVKTETTGHKISFAIPKRKEEVYQRFILIITEKIDFKSEENTIQYLKIPKKQKYKCYVIEQIKTDQPYRVKSSYQSLTNTNLSTKTNQFVYKWVINQEPNGLHDGIIPDDAIIVCFNPDYVDYIKESHNSVELPKIMIKKDLVALAGSEANVHDNSISLLLSSLDSDAIHATVEQQVKQDRQRTRITMVT